MVPHDRVNELNHHFLIRTHLPPKSPSGTTGEDNINCEALLEIRGPTGRKGEPKKKKVWMGHIPKMIEKYCTKQY